MKKLVTAFITLIALAGATAAQASTISLEPSATSVAVGQSFTVTISVDAGSAKVSTVKSAVSYPQDLVTPTSFSFSSQSPAWLALAEPGYDQMGAGSVVKTAGFPGGFSGAKVFGTITFTTKAAGTANIAVSSNSVAYDSASNNTLSGTQGSAAVTIAAPAAKTAQPTKTVTSKTQTAPTKTASASTKPTESTKTSTQKQQVAAAATAATTSAVATSSGVSTTSSATTTNSAEVAAAGSSGTMWWWILGALIIIAGIAGWIWFAKRN